MGMKKLKKAAMIAAASMFVMMVPMIQTHAAPTDVIENNESGIPDKTLYWKYSESTWQAKYRYFYRAGSIQRGRAGNCRL